MENAITTKHNSFYHSFFKLRFFEKSRTAKSFYNTYLYLIAALTFAVAIITLVIINSWNSTVGGTLKGAINFSDSKNPITIYFGTIDNFNTWLNSSEFHINVNNHDIIGGSYNIAIAAGLDSLTKAGLIISFVSVFIFFISLIVRKRSAFSILCISLTTIFFIVLLVIMSVLLVDANDGVFNDFNKLVNDLTTPSDEKFKAVQDFMVSLKNK